MTNVPAFDLLLVAGDASYTVTFNVQNSDGTVKDLTAYTAAAFDVWVPEASSNFLTGTASILSPATNGQVQYTVGVSDFPLSSAGRYYFAITVTGPNNLKETTIKSDGTNYVLLVAIPPP